MTAYRQVSNVKTLVFPALVAWPVGTVLGVFGTVPVLRTEVFVRLRIAIAVTVALSFMPAVVFGK